MGIGWRLFSGEDPVAGVGLGLWGRTWGPYSFYRDPRPVILN